MMHSKRFLLISPLIFVVGHFRLQIRREDETLRQNRIFNFFRVKFSKFDSFIYFSKYHEKFTPKPNLNYISSKNTLIHW